MKSFTKTLLASALVAAGMTGVTSAYATPEVSLSGELAVELTDSDATDDLDISVTTTDFVITVSESFGDIEVEGYQAFEKGDALARDGAGITVSGAFGSVFVGDDGTGVFVGDATDVLYNNSEAFFVDPTTNVIDYGLPLGDAVSLNVFVDSTSGDEADLDAIGVYGSYSVSGLTFALGYTSIDDEGAYALFEDDILDAFIGFEGGPIAAGFAYQATEALGADHTVMSLFLTYTAGALAITPYYEEREWDDTIVGDLSDEVIALNVSYSFTDNFYTFIETASYDSDGSDNTEVGLVLTF